MAQAQNKISQKEKEYANQLKKSLKVARVGMGLTNYKGSRGYQAIGMATTGAGSFGKGKGLRGASRDIALSEAKRRIISKTLEELGLEALAADLKTIKQGIQLGINLRNEINDTKFDNFITVLTLSVIKDFGDLASAGTLGTVLNLFIVPALFIVFFWRRSVLTKFVIKRFLWPFIPSAIVEFIPLLNTFPSYTLSALLLKRKINKRVRELEAAVEAVEKATKNSGKL